MNTNKQTNLFIDVNIRPADIHIHFRIVLLINQTVTDNRIGVFSRIMTVPTGPGLIGLGLGLLLAQGVRQLHPEASRVADGFSDFSDERF